MLHARIDSAGKQRMQGFPGVQTGVRQCFVSALASLVCPAPLRRSLSPIGAGNLESLIVVLLEGKRTVGGYVGSFELVLGCLCYFPESAMSWCRRLKTL